MKKEEKMVLCRPDIQTLYIDNFVFHRTHDGHILLSGIQESPGMRVEQVRCLITEEHANRLADILKKFLVNPPEKEINDHEQKSEIKKEKKSLSVPQNESSPLKTL